MFTVLLLQVLHIMINNFVCSIYSVKILSYSLWCSVHLLTLYILFSLAYTSYFASHVLPPPLLSPDWSPLVCSLWVSSFFVIFNRVIYFLDCAIQNIIQYLSFSIWPISFSLTPWIPSTLLQMAKVPCFMVGLSSTVSVCGYRHSVCVWVYTQRHLYIHTVASLGFPEGTSGREPTCKCKRWVTVQSLSQEDPLEKEAATHFSVQCLENSTNRGAWWAAVHGVTRVGHA